ncbi:MAG: hypothetical protein RIG61_09730 [Deltaproteobacteria bacterium]
MASGNKEIYKGIYFVLLSTLLAGLFFLLFGLFYGYEHPFFNLTLFLVFLGANLILSAVVYTVSIRDDKNGRSMGITVRFRNTLLMLVAALLLSVLFPASAILGLYPLSMAMFHLLILFCASLSLSAVNLSAVVFLWRNGTVVKGFNRIVFAFALIISLGISYTTLYLFGVLPVS